MGVRPLESIGDLRRQAEKLGIDHETIMSQEFGLRTLKMAISGKIRYLVQADTEAKIAAKAEAELVKVSINEQAEVEADQLGKPWPRVRAFGRRLRGRQD